MPADKLFFLWSTLILSWSWGFILPSTITAGAFSTSSRHVSEISHSTGHRFPRTLPSQNFPNKWSHIISTPDTQVRFAKARRFGPIPLSSSLLSETDTDISRNDDSDTVNVVLVTGFESFNRDLYEKAGALLPPECKINLQGNVFCIFLFVDFGCPSYKFNHQGKYILTFEFFYAKSRFID